MGWAWFLAEMSFRWILETEQCSLLGAFVPPKGHMAMPGDIFSCLYWGRGCYWHMVGRVQGCCSPPRNSWMALPQEGVIWPQSPEMFSLEGTLSGHGYSLCTWADRVQSSAPTFMACHLGRLMAFLEPGTRMDKLLPSLLAIACGKWHFCRA